MYSEINEQLSMGSLPISPGDVRLLRDKGVRVVVNLCRESAGPVEEYAKVGILQIRLHTPGERREAAAQVVVVARTSRMALRARLRPRLRAPRREWAPLVCVCGWGSALLESSLRADRYSGVRQAI
jgi:hypothetical protein